MLNSQPDEILIGLYQKGREEAFSVLFQRHRKGVYNFILRFFGQTQLAEDLFQDVFLKLIKNASHYENRTKFTTWMYTIVRNLCIDEYRKLKIRKVVSLEDGVKLRREGNGHEDKKRQDYIADDKPIADERLVFEERSYYVTRAVEKLPQEQREVLYLREKQDMSFQEIAEITSESVNTIKSRMRYALENIRKELKAMGIFNALKSSEEMNQHEVL